MRRLILASILGLSITPGLALAQDADNGPPPGGPGMMPPPGGPDMPPPQGAGWKHHGDHGHDWGIGGPEMLDAFYNANTTHDGHLTLAQAKAANLRPVVDHFADIDVSHRGYVTFNDIMAWRLDDMAKHLEAEAAKIRAQDN